MFLTALCPTFRHPELLANSLALWEMQDYPADQRRLIILDDGGTFDEQRGPNWHLFASAVRFPSLPAKYNHMLGEVPLAPATGSLGAVVVWDDDDLYLPGYLSAHARCLAEHEFSKPAIILSDYPGAGRIQAESGAGRFHSSMAFRAELIYRVGGWIQTKRADFDQQMIAALHHQAASTGSPWDQASDCQWVYGWHTGGPHCSSSMRGPDDETWYDRVEQSYATVAQVGRLTPQLDPRTHAMLEALAVLRPSPLRA